MKAKRVWFDGERIYIETDDGRTLWQSILYYQRLKNATEEQRNDYELGAFGIHWEEIDEDLSFEGFFRQKSSNTLYELFMAHPEINVSAVARRLGMAQSLLAQYISGTKRPSDERMECIKAEIRQIGAELSAI